MSDAVYPTLPGLAYGVVRGVIPPPVTIKTTPSRREYRARDAVNPVYAYTLPYEFLRSDAVWAELQTLVGFYNLRGGPFDSFLFTDPDDNAVTAQPFGVGDGSTAVFQLVRSYGGFAEPVRDLNGAPVLSITDWRGVWTPTTVNRSNTLKYSEEFQQASAWTANPSLTVSADSTVAPDGTMTADTLTDANTGGNGSISQATTIADGTATRTFSEYVKKTSGGTSPSLRISLDYSGGTAIASRAVIDTDTGAVLATVLSANGSAGVIDAHPSWWRVWIAEKNNGTGNTTLTVTIYPAFAAHGASSGDVSQTGSAICWGAQLETNVGPRAYIKTGSSASGSAPDYTVAAGVVTFRAAPWATAALAWTGAFYRRVRFVGDRFDPTEFLRNLWSGRVELLSTET